MKIFVLGPTQSGKTCLAVGLSATAYGKTLFRRAFEASANDAASRDHLRTLRKLLQSGKWPAGTTGTDELEFGFRWKGGTKVVFSFQDYKGERSTDPARLKALGELGGEDGVVLLVNPGFEFRYVVGPGGTPRLPNEVESTDSETAASLPVSSAFADSPLARAWLEEEEDIYDRLVESLKTRNGEEKAAKPVVALAVTASDRLRRKGDLRNIRPRFEEFLARIATKLETAGFRWKRFDVSVTGSLADQNTPKLGRGLANTSPRPFLWIFGQLWWRTHWRMLAKAAKWAAGIAVVAAIGSGAYEYARSVKHAKDVASVHSDCLGILETEPFKLAHLKSAKGCIDALRHQKGFYVETARLKADELEGPVWEKQKELIQKEINSISHSDGKRGDRKDLKTVDDLFSAFQPEQETLAGDFNKFRRQWEKEQKPGFLDKHDEWVFTSKIDMVLNNSATNHGHDALSALYPLADIINGVNSAKLADAKTNRAERVDGRIAMEWRDFLIPDFEEKASDSATRDATRAFRVRLDDWTPVSPSGKVVKAELVASVSNSVPLWRTTYESNRLERTVVAPIRKLDGKSGPAVRETLVGLKPEFNDVDKTDTLTEELESFEKKCRIMVDNRFSEEWDLTIKEFGYNAAERASEEGFHGLRSELVNWSLCSQKSRPLYSNNLATVDSLKPTWRTTYETNRWFVSATNAALAKNPDPATLASFHPDRAELGEYLPPEFVQSIWTDIVRKTFEESCSNVVAKYIPKDAKKTPELTDLQRQELKRAAKTIGKPLSEDTLLLQAEERLAEVRKRWADQYREQCRNWWEKNKSKVDRLELLREYEQSRNFKGELRNVPKDIFGEEVSSNVYARVENWFEEDVQYFQNEIYPANGPSLWDDEVNFETRFSILQKRFVVFRDLCDEIKDDDNAYSPSWAKRFADLCWEDETVCGNVESGDLFKAFPIRYELRKVEGKTGYIDGDKTFATGYKYTSFAFGFEYGKGKAMDWIVFPDKGGDAPKNGPKIDAKEKDGIWVDLMPAYAASPKQISVSFFQHIRFVCKATDYNWYASAPARTGDSSTIFIPPYSGETNTTVSGTIHLSGRTENGWHTKLNEDPPFWIRLTYAPTTIASPLVLLKQAKVKTNKQQSKKDDAK